VTVEESAAVIARIPKGDGVEIHVCRAGSAELELRDYAVATGTYGPGYRVPMSALAELARSWQAVPAPRGGR
jgi:hypothetical protein